MGRRRVHILVSMLLLASTICFGSSSGERPIRILSIDGGGIRGLIPAVALEKIEQTMGKPIAKIFDMVAGTSTGGILALGFTAPTHMQTPVVTAQEAVDLYIQEGDNIFSCTPAHWLLNLGGLLGPKYESTGLANLLTEKLGDRRMSEALIPTLITGYHVEGKTGVEFFSEDAKNFPNDKDCSMFDVGMATAAAPTYFDSVDVQYPWGSLRNVVDGALYKHDPALLAYVTAKKMYPNRRIEIYSLGTGIMSAEEMNAELKGRGLLHWLEPILKHILIGSSEADNSILHRLMNENGQENYFRLTVRLAHGHHKMDDASGENLRYLYEQGMDATKSDTFRRMIQRLKQ